MNKKHIPCGNKDCRFYGIGKVTQLYCIAFPVKYQKEYCKKYTPETLTPTADELKEILKAGKKMHCISIEKITKRQWHLEMIDGCFVVVFHGDIEHPEIMEAGSYGWNLANGINKWQEYHPEQTEYNCNFCGSDFYSSEDYPNCPECGINNCDYHPEQPEKEIEQILNHYDNKCTKDMDERQFIKLARGTIRQIREQLEFPQEEHPTTEQPEQEEIKKVWEYCGECGKKVLMPLFTPDNEEPYVECPECEKRNKTEQEERSCETCGGLGYTQPPHSIICPDCQPKQSGIDWKPIRPEISYEQWQYEENVNKGIQQAHDAINKQAEEIARLRAELAELKKDGE